MLLALLGDTHANEQDTYRHIEQAARHEVDVIVQLGDFAYTGKYRQKFLSLLCSWLKTRRLKLFWIDGNHDDQDELDVEEINGDGFGQTRPNIFHIPRGHRWTWEGVDFMGVGGAYSIDKESRTYIGPFHPQNSYWPQETITEGQVIHASRPGNVEIMFTHDVPAGIKYPYGPATGGGNKDHWPESYANRQALRTIVDMVEPNYLYHGHCHYYYQDDLTLDNGHVVKVMGLARDTMKNQYKLLEI